MRLSPLDSLSKREFGIGQFSASQVSWSGVRLFSTDLGIMIWLILKTFTKQSIFFCVKYSKSYQTFSKDGQTFLRTKTKSVNFFIEKYSNSQPPAKISLFVNQQSIIQNAHDQYFDYGV